MGNKIKMIIVSFITIFLLTGCWGKTETEERRYVVTMGIDCEDSYSDISEKYNVYGQDKSYIASIGEAELKSEIQNEEEKTQMPVISGESISDIRWLADDKSDKHIYFGQLKTAVLGKKLIKDKEKFKNIIFDIERSDEINTKVISIVAEDTAVEIVQAIMDEKNGNGMYIWNYYKNNGSETDTGQYMDFEHMVKSMRNGKSFIVPIVSLQDGSIMISGGSVFSNGEYCGDINKEEIDGLKWIKGNADGAIINDENISARVLSQKSDFVNNDGVYTIEINADCVIENGEITENSMEGLKKVIKEKIENTINRAVKLNADYIGVTDDGNIDGLRYDVAVNLKISSTGVIK